MAIGVSASVGTPTAEQVEEFLSESATMQGFHHPNVLSLLAVCFGTETQPPLVILPYMANGDLKSFLSSKRQTVSENNTYDHFPDVSYPSTEVTACRRSCPY